MRMSLSEIFVAILVIFCFVVFYLLVLTVAVNAEQVFEEIFLRSLTDR